MTVTVLVLLYGGIVTGPLAQRDGTNSASKMSSQQMMDKLNHLSTKERAEMFDKMTDNNKMEAMKVAGHDMSKMSHQERMGMMNKLTLEQRAGMFDKMPLDTRMATIRMAMKEQSKGN
jgi:hypothetical protein